MPGLPLPLGSGVGGTAASLVASSLQDIYNVLPLLMHPDDPAIVRDAILNALLAIVERYQIRSLYAAQQSDILTANGVFLKQAAAELGVFAQPGESDSSLRARAITAPSIVTPNAIIAAVNTILAPFTSVSAKYCESLSDRWYAYSDADTWTSGSSPRAYTYSDKSQPQSPDYADRLYVSESSQNGGYATQYREPGAARVFSDVIGREFLIRVPDVSSINSQNVPAYTESTPFPSRALYVGTGVSATNTRFIRQLAASSTFVYSQIVNTVNRIKGASMRWILLVDPKLVT